MSIAQLESCREKITRANKHIDEIDGLIKGFFESKPYEIVLKKDVPTAGRLSYRLQILKEPPAGWGPVIGDVLYNLRSALDHLACQLVIAGGGTCTHETEFPIAKNRKAFESRLGSVSGASKKAKRILRAHKPYAGGNDLLWALHQLNRVEKHRFPLTVFARAKNVILTFKMNIPGQDAPVEFPPIALVGTDWRDPLVDDVELFNDLLDQATSRPSSGDNPKFTIQIAFGEPQIVIDEPLSDTLHKMASVVDSVVNSFEPIFRPPPHGGGSGRSTAVKGIVP